MPQEHPTHTKKTSQSAIQNDIAFKWYKCPTVWVPESYANTMHTHKAMEELNQYVSTTGT